MGPLARGIVLIAGVALLAGCGGDDDYANNPRPPAPIVVSAALVGDELTVSPKRFGAGMVELIVTNQTREPARLRLETDEIGGQSAGIRRESTTIVPGGTGSLKAFMREGQYRLAVVDGDAAARIRVGEPRGSAQDQLLLP